jgi:predicted DNA-binding transcriptional regulator YafY
MLGIPAPLAELGVGEDARSALLKLSASLAAVHRQDEEHANQRIHLDPSGRYQVRKPVPLLATIQQALWEDLRLELTYRLPFETQVRRLVEPYGLVAKDTSWHLVCGQDQHVRVHRVSQLVEANLTSEHFARPEDWDLVRFWQTWCAETEANRPRYPATLRIAPEFTPYLARHFEDIADTGRGSGLWDGEDWIELTLFFDTLEDARRRILGCGAAVEVVDPAVLRQSVLDFAQQTAAVYEG